MLTGTGDTQARRPSLAPYRLRGHSPGVATRMPAMPTRGDMLRLSRMVGRNADQLANGPASVISASPVCGSLGMLYSLAILLPRCRQAGLRGVWDTSMAGEGAAGLLTITPRAGPGTRPVWSAWPSHTDHVSIPRVLDEFSLGLSSDPALLLQNAGLHNVGTNPETDLRTGGQRLHGSSPGAR